MADIQKLLDEISKLTVLEVSELVKAMEEKFGVSSAPVAVSASSTMPTTGEDEKKEEQSTFNVVLVNGGSQKIAVIKVVRELVPTLGLKEAKDLVDAGNKEVLTGVSKTQADEAKKKLTEAGATVELK